MDLTSQEDAIVSGGLAAQALLESGTYLSAIKTVVQDCFEAFVTSRPGDARNREDTYNLYRGLQAIEAELNSRVQAMEEIVRRLDAAKDDTEPYQD